MQITAFYLADWGEVTTKTKAETGAGLSDRRNDLYLNWYAALLMIGIFIQVEFGYTSRDLHPEVQFSKNVFSCSGDERSLSSRASNGRKSQVS